MLKYFFTVLASSFILLNTSCTKDSSTSTTEYYFRYTVNGKMLGYTSKPTSSNTYFLLNAVYDAKASSRGILSSSKLSDCNTNGRPPCYRAEIYLPSLSVATHLLTKSDNYLWIRENEFSTSEVNYWINLGNLLSDGNVILTEVGPIGGVVVGTFSGRASTDQSNLLVPISGSFRLRRSE